MPGLGLKNFGSEVLTSNDVDGYLMQQTVMVFASDAARTTAFTSASISPSEGMMAYLLDANVLQVYTGALWRTITSSSGSGKILNVSVAEGDATYIQWHYSTKTRVTNYDYSVTAVADNSRYLVWHYNWTGSRTNAAASEIWYQVNGGAFSYLGTLNDTYASGSMIWNSGSTDLWYATSWNQAHTITASAGATVNFSIYLLSGGAGGISLAGTADAFGHPNVRYRWVVMELTP